MNEQEHKPPESEELAVIIDSNVIDLATRRKPASPTEPLFTDDERREIRELMAYMRTQRPIFEAAMTRCTILRRLSEES